MGVSAELWMITHKGEGTWATHSLTRLGRPLRKFLGVRCGRVKLLQNSVRAVTLGFSGQFTENFPSY